MRSFFRKGNLIALRELALRRTADRVDAQMRTYMREHAIAKTWPVAERLLVCIGPKPAGGPAGPARGSAWPPASAPSGSWPSWSARRGQAGAADRDRVIQTLRLAEQLGAEAALAGQTMSDEILAYAQDPNVTKIVVGKPTRSLWKRILIGSIVDALVEGSGEIDIYVGERGEAEARVRRGAGARGDGLAGYAEALGVIALCTGLAWLIFPYFNLSNLVMVYLPRRRGSRRAIRARPDGARLGAERRGV